MEQKEKDMLHFIVPFYAYFCHHIDQTEIFH